MIAVNQVPVNTPVTPTTSDDYFQNVVITALLAILKDQSLNTHHPTVIEAIMSIFKTQGSFLRYSKVPPPLSVHMLTHC
jgi:FKBP12-rapamycin complex-associated protein